MINDPLDPIVITGAGVLACNGIGRENFWEALEHGRSGIRFIDRFDTSRLPCKVAGQLWDFEPSDYLKKAEVSRWHRHVHQSLAATQLALEDAELESAGYHPERIAIGMGTSVGGPDEHYLKYRESYESADYKKLGKFASSASSGHAATATVSARFHLRGPATTIASGCATGLDLMNWGCTQIRAGMADVSVIGATEAPLTELTLASACALGITTHCEDEPGTAMRPFDQTGDGLALSEGAVVLVLERAQNARSRGAPILGEIAGYGAASEGSNPIVIDKEGKALARAISTALENSGMSSADLDCAHCHGVSLGMYDRSETNAYKIALGEYAYRIPVSAGKSMIGQAYSTGALYSVVGALMSLNTGVMPPTINHHEPYPDCDLDYVPLRARVNDIQTVLVTALSFGGTHGASVLRRA